MSLSTASRAPTQSKMFSRCPARFGAPANTLVDPVVLGLPGALPVPNRDAITMALSLATALGGTLATATRFDRKNYFYPDLPKGYQISQYELPLASHGQLTVETTKPLGTGESEGSKVMACGSFRSSLAISAVP